MSTLHTLSLVQLIAGVRDGEFTADDIASYFADRCRELGPALNCFNWIEPDAAAPEGPGALAGVPYATKANIAVQDQELSCNSRILAGYRPPYEATATARLRRAGARVIAQANMDEFAMGSSTENSAAGPVKNPWDVTRTPGGSSGGSAAAVAAGLVPFALGSDTGGSIRQPAALCGVVGLKPTYGRVSRRGLVAFASSLDQIGPITRGVADAALVYRELAGHDPGDATSLREPVEDPLVVLEDGAEGLRIGVPRHLLAEGVDAGVLEHFERVLGELESRGATLVDVELPSAGHAIATYYVICTAEASSNLARFDGVRYGHRAKADTLSQLYQRSREEGFGPEVQLRVLLGTYVLSAGYYDAYYRKAQQVRTLLRREYAAALEGCDVLATPTAPTPAFGLGEKVDDPVQMYLNDVFTASANLTGLPAISVPTGLSGGGLPLSLQFTGGALQEATLLRAARAAEVASGYELPAQLPFEAQRGGS